MQKHPKHSSRCSAKRQRKSPTPRRARYRIEAPPLATRPAVPYGKAPQDGLGFMRLLLNRIAWSQLEGLQAHKHKAGRPAHDLSRGQLLAAVLFHYTVTWAGTLAEHLFWLMGIEMSDGTLSERRQALPFIVFEELLRRLLCPLNLPSAQAFYRGWRLVTSDGVFLRNRAARSFSCSSRPTNIAFSSRAETFGARSNADMIGTSCTRCQSRARHSSFFTGT